MGDNPNTISGSIYDDTLQGTDQDDTFVYEGGSDIILALDGFDSLEIPESAVNFKSGQIDNLLSIFPGSHFTKYGDVVIRAENLESVSFIDSSWNYDFSVSPSSTLFGTVGSDDLTGNDADDKIDGLGGEDIIDGSFGTDASTYLIMSRNHYALT